MAKYSKEEIKALMKKYGKYMTSKEIAEAFKGCSTPALQSGLNQILNKRRKGKGRIERWLETYMTNYYIENGKLPDSETIRELIVDIFDVPYVEKKDYYGKPVKKFTKNIEKLMLRVRKRISRKIKEGKIKHKAQSIEELKEVYFSYKQGYADVMELMKVWNREKIWFSREEKKTWRRMFIEAGVSKLFFEGERLEE